MIRKDGLSKTNRYFTDWTARSVLKMRRIEFVWLEPEHAVLPEIVGAPLEHRFLAPDEIKKFIQQPIHDLNHEMIARIESGEHWCYAAIDGEHLAAYGWYARKDVAPDDCFGFGMKLPSDIAYMYKGYTHPEYRGRRLHGFLMVKALEELHKNGVKAIISSVDWTNAASLKSCERIGYEMLGQGVLWSLLGHQNMTVPVIARQRGVQFYC
jgi:ribosomal protein S18 acetylase RimI-like enzyme